MPRAKAHCENSAFESYGPVSLASDAHLAGSYCLMPVRNGRRILGHELKIYDGLEQLLKWIRVKFAVGSVAVYPENSVVFLVRESFRF